MLARDRLQIKRKTILALDGVRREGCEDRRILKPPLAFQVLRFIWSEKRGLYKVVKQQCKHNSEKQCHKAVVNEPVPHQWSRKRLPQMAPGGHSAAVLSEVFPEQVDGFWFPLHPGPPVRTCSVPFHTWPEGLISR